MAEVRAHIGAFNVVMSLRFQCKHGISWLIVLTNMSDASGGPPPWVLDVGLVTLHYEALLITKLSEMCHRIGMLLTHPE